MAWAALAVEVVVEDLVAAAEGAPLCQRTHGDVEHNTGDGSDDGAGDPQQKH